MTGRTRVSGLRRGLAPGAVACLVLGAGACSAGGSHEYSAAPGSGGSGFSQAGASGASSGSVIDVGGASGASAVVVPCRPEMVSKPIFLDQAFEHTGPARRELYSWTSDEQAAALRRDRVLFTETERPGLGPGYAFTVLQMLADTAAPEPKQLAGLLVQRFAKGRYGWPEPWATRMGWPGESYGRNLLRIVLRPEAWLVVVENGSLRVVDLQNQAVELATALASPERLGAILYNKDAFEGGPSCGSFGGGINGYREFIVGNLAMVEQWSLSTQEIRERLSANIAQLTRFLGAIRACPIPTNPDAWNLQVVCAWPVHFEPPFTETAAYEAALAIPSPNYLPIPERIAHMIDTLQGDLFEPDPLLVTPGAP